MPKRNCPFPSTGQPLKTHVDIRSVGKEEYKKEVYRKTSQLLAKGAKDAALCNLKDSKGKKNIGPVFQRREHKCGACSQYDISTAKSICAFCDKETCTNCCRTCDECGGKFCVMCSVLNYDERDERAFCLSCKP